MLGKTLGNKQLNKKRSELESFKKQEILKNSNVQNRALKSQLNLSLLQEIILYSLKVVKTNTQIAFMLI